MAAAQIYPSIDASVEACFPNRYEPIQAPPSRKETTVRNRFRRRESESLNHWPVYELYVRHPHVPNFFLLPTYYEKTLPVASHSPPSWAPSPHPPCHCHRLAAHPSPSATPPQQLPLPPSSHISRSQIVHEKTPKTNKSTRTKRKYEELFNEEQFLKDREELSVFLDFENI
jgi:hypothetical protein